ncbi:MAG TPA: septum formation initiator family protein [Thermoanaerobaculia bacterium]|nr:septum formation initiator family protein [Thermoanaerobaculia bacterium]
MTRAEAPVRPDSFRPVLGAAVVLFLALLAVAALKSYRDLASARAHQHMLERQIHETVARSEWLRSRIDRLHHDPGMLERLAREDLGMVRPNDVVIELPDGAVAPLASRAPKAVTAGLISPPADFVGPPAPPPPAAPVPVPAAVPVAGPPRPPG